jgi:hypothetical protein
MAAFAIAIAALGVINSVLLLVLVWRRVRLAQRARRRLTIETRLRPTVLTFVDGQGELPHELTRREQEVLADLLGKYGRLLRGPSSARIAAYFEHEGTVARELAALAGDRQAWRRAGAAYRLGNVGSATAAAGLTAALGDVSREVRSAAARSLGKLRSAAAVDPLLAAVAARRIPPALVGWALLQIGAAALPQLRAAVENEQPANRAGAVRMLGLLGDAPDAELVATRLRDTSALVRTAAARALARIGGSGNVPALLAALDDRVPSVRAAAAEALGRLRVQDTERLLELARDDGFEVSRAAARAAVRIDPRAAEAAARAANAAHLEEAVALGHL